MKHNSHDEIILLFDFFGELLTEKQRQYIDLYYNEDLSLAEIAETECISRQGVRDIIVRGEKILREYEDKTGALERYMRSRSDADKLEKLAECIEGGQSGAEIAAELRAVAARLRE